MSRGRSQNPNNRNHHIPHNQLDVFGRHDPFQQMNQVMRSFGGFGGMSMFNDSFFKDDFMMKPFGDPFERMMGFSDMHQSAHRNGKQGSYVSQTFVSSSTIGPDGKVQKHSYYENSAGEHKNGKTISQKQQAYKNSDGVNRIAEERMLNNKGHKIVKEKRGNDVEETNHYYNIEEDEVQNFHQSWKNTDSELKFLDNYNKHMRSIENGRSSQQPRQLELGYHQPSYQQERHPRVESRQRLQQESNYSTKMSQRGSQPGSRGSKKY